MSETNPQFPPLSKLQAASGQKAWTAKIPERMRLAILLLDHAGAIPAEGFFSWDAVREYLSRADGGIFSGGAARRDADAGVERPGTNLYPQTPLLVGVSGGADSVALVSLSLACNLSEMFSSIFCCHINHRLRGAESDQDMQYCSNLSKHFDINFVSTVADDGQAEAFRSQGSEESFREFRYGAFHGHAQKIGARIVALAHTLNDQVETMLFRSFRGTSAAGMRGIPCVRLQEGILIVRPLIDVARDQIIEFLQYADIAWREDSSNKQLHYSRNFIRSELVPRIESEFPDFESRMEKMRQLFADDEELLKALCLSQISQVEGKNANSWQLAKLEPLPVALKRRMFAHALKSRGIEVSFERVDKLVNMTVGNNQLESLDYGSPPTARALSLNERWDVVRRKDHLMFIDKEDKSEETVQADPIAVRIPGMTIVPALNKVMFVEALEPSDKGPKRFPAEDAFEAVVSLAKVQSQLVIRERQPGDCIQPFGMQETVKLKKYLHTHKQDDDESTGRRKLYVLASGEEVLWVPGVGISEKLRVTGRPTHTLKLLDIGIGETTLC